MVDSDDDVIVEIPRVLCPLEPEEMAVLQSVFSNDPFDDLDGDMGTSLYISIREFVRRCVDLHNQR